MVSVGGVLFFAHAFGAGRRNGWIKFSVDDGASWWLWRQIDPGPFGYSGLTPLHRNQTHVTLGIVYEECPSVGGCRILWLNVTSLLPRTS